MDYLYQIKMCHPDSVYGNKGVITQDIITEENKKKVIAFLEEESPEYFEGNTRSFFLYIGR